MPGADLAISSNRVVTPGGVVSATVLARDGTIVAIEPRRTDGTTLDVGDAVIMPGVVDTHVHVNEPGRAEWEGFETATDAAAAGGVTTLVDMPLNSDPVTTSRTALARKVVVANGKCRVDYGFWGGIVPENAAHLEGLIADGVLGFKCFLVPSGIDEFSHVGEHELREAMPVFARHGVTLLAHAEVPEPIDAALCTLSADVDRRAYQHYLATRPRDAEHQAIDLLIRLSQETDCAVHVVHLSSADALPRLLVARSEGVAISVETCPHYLTFAAEEIPAGATTYKCAPPIREAENRERLWGGLASGIIDLVASDHSPCPPAMKRLDSGDFLAAWGGIASLQLTLPALWTAMRERNFGLRDLATWLCEAPARLAGVGERKGRLAAGYDADLVVWDPEATFVVRGAALLHRHKLTPYEGRTLTGVVQRTFVRGMPVCDAGKPTGARAGQRLVREGR